MRSVGDPGRRNEKQVRIGCNSSLAAQRTSNHQQQSTSSHGSSQPVTESRLEQASQKKYLLGISTLASATAYYNPRGVSVYKTGSFSRARTFLFASRFSWFSSTRSLASIACHLSLSPPPRTQLLVARARSGHAHLSVWHSLKDPATPSCQLLLRGGRAAARLVKAADTDAAGFRCLLALLPAGGSRCNRGLLLLAFYFPVTD
ncbi:hypothetical protein BaRGS_00001900 [Batillaria attramentaria]|uniref:Uncharacterized protein n=1 Tax=Batillaria attramentaria TaxID=370345 RepID=A0ABD0M544_9CAEN